MVKVFNQKGTIVREIKKDKIIKKEDKKTEDPKVPIE